uniref:Type VI secretion system-associated FHA domain protein TagH n=1 Tax=Anisakis simplex TaxID=6269 RepID=A0A0M3J7F0_ANISI
LVIPQNSGLRAVAPPVDFEGGFGSSSHGSSPDLFGSGSGGSGLIPSGSSGNVDESMFTGESALTPNRNGPTGDGFGPPLFPGAAVPPPVPAIGLGGDAAGLSPYRLDPDHLKNPPTTVKPSALLSMLSKADIGFNQAINHFEQGTPLESAAIDILEVALGSEKLDSQAKLLGHVDRAIGIDNLQRLQRWANTGGALDAIKEQVNSTNESNIQSIHSADLTIR